MSELEITHVGKSAAAPKRRWRPRFSLRTLLIFVLLVGSGALLWWNWGPFAPALTINENRPIAEIRFVGAKDEYLYVRILVSSLTDHEIKREYETVLIDAQTGRRMDWTQDIHLKDGIHFSKTGKYFHWDGVEDWFVLRQIDTGSIIDLRKFGNGNFYFSPKEEYVRMRVADVATLLKLPELTVVGTYSRQRNFSFHNGDPGPFISHNEEWIVNLSTDTAHIVSLKTGAVIRELPSSKRIRQVEISQQDDKVAILEEFNDKWQTRVYEVNSGKMLCEFEHEHSGPGDQATYSVVIEFSENGNFIFAERQYHGYGGVLFFGHFANLPEVWALEPTPRKVALYAPKESAGFTPHGDQLICDFPSQAWDIHTGKVIWTSKLLSNYEQSMPYVVSSAKTSVIFKNPATGVDCFELAQWRWRTSPQRAADVRLSKDPSRFVMYTSTWDSSPYTEAHYRATVWRQMRPLEWYGIAWLPEFWAVILLAAGLMWSLWRDRRMR